nr:hypothetical protein [Tanacetum cinerariifolium]
MASLADKAILSGADNRPPMLEKDMYDLWKSRMELYMLNRPHDRMILESVEQGLLIWPSVEVEAVNTKFLNTLPAEWSKFGTDVKLVRDLHTTNLHSYLEQHELHSNEVRIMREHKKHPLALVANQQMTPSHFNTYQSSYNNPQFQQQFSPSQSPQYGSIHPTQHYFLGIVLGI